MYRPRIRYSQGDFIALFGRSSRESRILNQEAQDWLESRSRPVLLRTSSSYSLVHVGRADARASVGPRSITGELHVNHLVTGALVDLLIVRDHHVGSAISVRIAGGNVCRADA